MSAVLDDEAVAVAAAVCVCVWSRGGATALRGLGGCRPALCAAISVDAVVVTGEPDRALWPASPLHGNDTSSRPRFPPIPSAAACACSWGEWDPAAGAGGPWGQYVDGAGAGGFYQQPAAGGYMGGYQGEQGGQYINQQGGQYLDQQTGGY